MLCFSVSEEILNSLHSLFGAAFFRATELLESTSITLYQTTDGSRKLFKLIRGNEQYFVFPNINFCCCQAFRYHVVQSSISITCKHVLAVALVQITKKFQTEALTDLQFAELLNEEVNR